MHIWSADADTHIGVMEIVLGANPMELAGGVGPGVKQDVVSTSVIVAGVE